ncbi:hypothetical protein SAY86_031311 [Trapa natans]|uniref:Uncharacterized protein n=1 Tax=Trapa natans TaxID=22666 RepID=A0AAN7M365_TRANT|nr:hypothetical protein SAY86_031311 [Trapa natans]
MVVVTSVGKVVVGASLRVVELGKVVVIAMGVVRAREGTGMVVMMVVVEKVMVVVMGGVMALEGTGMVVVVNAEGKEAEDEEADVAVVASEWVV